MAALVLQDASVDQIRQVPLLSYPNITALPAALAVAKRGREALADEDRRAELTSLSANIAVVHQRLLVLTTTDSPSDPKTPKTPKTSKAEAAPFTHFTEPPSTRPKSQRAPSRFTRIASNLRLHPRQRDWPAFPRSPRTPRDPRSPRLASFALGRSKYAKLTANNDDTLRLLEEQGRRGSAESQITLVDSCSADRSITQVDAEAERVHSPETLLVHLAPLIATLQKLSGKVSALPARSALRGNTELDSIKELFDEICQNLLSLLDDLQPVSSVGRPDQHELEMTHLLLSALAKKVQSERERISSLHVPLRPRSQVYRVVPVPPSLSRSVSTASTLSRGSTSSTSTLSLSPMVSRNPFVAHSTALLPAQAKAGRTKSVPIQGQEPLISPMSGLDGGMAYSSFASSSQSSVWAMNVVRLGSFQASMLFSPSPVAVRRTADSGHRNVSR